MFPRTESVLAESPAALRESCSTEMKRIWPFCPRPTLMQVENRQNPTPAVLSKDPAVLLAIRLRPTLCASYGVPVGHLLGLPRSNMASWRHFPREGHFGIEPARSAKFQNTPILNWLPMQKWHLPAVSKHPRGILRPLEKPHGILVSSFRERDCDPNRSFFDPH